MPENIYSEIKLCKSQEKLIGTKRHIRLPVMLYFHSNSFSFCTRVHMCACVWRYSFKGNTDVELIWFYVCFFKKICLHFDHPYFHILCSGIKIPENCVARVRDELDRMDKEVKRKRKEKELQAQEQRLAEQRRRMLEERHMLYSHPPQLSSLTTLYNGRSFPSFPSHLQTSTEGILDLTVGGSACLSSHSTGAGVLTDFSVEAFTQVEQQQQSLAALRDSVQQELFNYATHCEPCHSALPSSSDSLHTAIPASTSLFSTSIHPSSSSSSLFSPSLTPSSSSSSLSLFSSLSPSDQHPFANCNDDTVINAKEVLSNMLRSSDSRQSVIHFRVPESEHLS